MVAHTEGGTQGEGAEEDMWRDEATGEWRKLHNEELHDLFASPSICPVTTFKKMR